MPIGDLLAEISGGQDAPAAAPPPTSTIKRKAESPNRAPSKVAKARHPGTSSSTPSAPSGSLAARPAASRDRQSSSALPRDHPAKLPPTTAQRYTGSASLTRPSGVNKPVGSNRPKPISSSLPPKSEASAKPALASPSTPDASKVPPKKGSFAEIMARASKAQQNMAKVGVITHKATDKPARQKERQPAPAGQKPGAKVAPPKAGYKGSARPATAPPRDAPRENSSKPTKAPVRPQGSAPSAEAAAKKPKKAVTATTGYTGTARPAPGGPAKKHAGGREGGRPSSRPGGILAPPKAKRRDEYEEDYDEELDDFIDYDDDEDEMDPRQRKYNYASDESSDMEAGMSDIDDEEQLAERAARAEDRREKELEDRLKREKEQRRREWNRR